MKGLNFFQAIDLARAGYAVRLEEWERWLLYRSGVGWLISEVIDGVEIRRVPRGRRLSANPPDPDMTDSALLAKNWTTEVWEKGALPPCTRTDDPKTLPPHFSGGAGAWSFDDRCGGEGSGGGVVPDFPPVFYNITVEDLLHGTLVFNPRGDTVSPGTHYAPGTVVVITPVPDDEYVFDHWLGMGGDGVVGEDHTLTLTMDGNRSIQALFATAPLDPDEPFTVDAFGSFNDESYYPEGSFSQGATSADSTEVVHDVGGDFVRVCFTTVPARAKLSVFGSTSPRPNIIRLGTYVFAYNVGGETGTHTLVNPAEVRWVFDDVLTSDPTGTVSVTYTPSSGYGAGTPVTATSDPVDLPRECA